MCSIRRFIDEELRRWKDGTRRKPLILRGARQVGKTWLLKEFGKNRFESLALVDLERNPPLRRLFDGDLGAAGEEQFCRGGLSGCSEWQDSSGGGEKRRHRQPEKPASVHGRIPGVRQGAGLFRPTLCRSAGTENHLHAALQRLYGERGARDAG